MPRFERVGKWPWYVPAAALWVAFLAAFAWYASRKHPGGAGPPPSAPHRIPEWMMTDGDAHPLLQEMEAIERLVAEHQKIRRIVEEISGGIASASRSRSWPSSWASRRAHRRPDAEEVSRECSRTKPMDPGVPAVWGRGPGLYATDV